MALFRRFLHRKQRDRDRDRHLQNSDWVLVDGQPSPAQNNDNNNNDNVSTSLAARDGGEAPTPPTPPPSPPMEGRCSLKPLNWEKVNKALEGSLWEELQIHGHPQRTPPEIDVSELQQLFSNTPPKTVSSKEAEKRKASSSIPEKVQLIDPLRASNTEIMLLDVKLPLPCIVDAVLAMDDTALDVDQVENLLKFFPKKEEKEILKSYTGDQDKLGQCEQYFLELMKVPRMESKLNALMFKLQFNSQLAEFENNLNTINIACDEVRNSDKLKEIMKRILYLGNALNQGTDRGAAVGFKLDSLMKLTDTRAANSGLTFMHYLCKLFATKSPELLDFHEDLVSLEAATKIELKKLADQMLDLSDGLKKAKQELDASANDGPVSTGFHMGKSADGLALYFGEDPARCPFEEATQTLLNFVRLFLKCHKENLERGELQIKESQDGDGDAMSPPPPQSLLAHVENNNMETCLPSLAVRDGSQTTSLSPPAPPPAIQSLGDASTSFSPPQSTQATLPTAPELKGPQPVSHPTSPHQVHEASSSSITSSLPMEGASTPSRPPGEHLDL